MTRWLVLSVLLGVQCLCLCSSEDEGGRKEPAAAVSVAGKHHHEATSEPTLASTSPATSVVHNNGRHRGDAPKTIPSLSSNSESTVATSSPIPENPPSSEVKDKEIADLPTTNHTHQRSRPVGGRVTHASLAQKGDRTSTRASPVRGDVPKEGSPSGVRPKLSQMDGLTIPVENDKSAVKTASLGVSPIQDHPPVTLATPSQGSADQELPLPAANDSSTESELSKKTSIPDRPPAKESLGDAHSNVSPKKTSSPAATSGSTREENAPADVVTISQDASIKTPSDIPTKETHETKLSQLPANDSSTTSEVDPNNASTKPTPFEVEGSAVSVSSDQNERKDNNSSSLCDPECASESRDHHVSIASSPLAQLVLMLSKPGVFSEGKSVFGDELEVDATSCPPGDFGLACRRAEAMRGADECSGGNCEECRSCDEMEITDWPHCCRENFRCCSQLALACQQCDQPTLQSFCTTHFKRCS